MGRRSKQADQYPRTRVGALAWNGDILSSGSRDRHVFRHTSSLPPSFPLPLAGHRLDDTHGHTPGSREGSPHHHGLLASGGGTVDRCIRSWNTLTSQPMLSNRTCFRSPTSCPVASSARSSLFPRFLPSNVRLQTRTVLCGSSCLRCRCLSLAEARPETGSRAIALITGSLSPRGGLFPASGLEGTCATPPSQGPTHIPQGIIFSFPRELFFDPWTRKRFPWE